EPFVDNGSDQTYPACMHSHTLILYTMRILASPHTTNGARPADANHLIQQSRRPAAAQVSRSTCDIRLVLSTTQQPIAVSRTWHPAAEMTTIVYPTAPYTPHQFT
ncbi:MAG: hypothetical protein ABJQ14_12945, partial [Hyphomicrobiales bacterium]